MKYYLFIKSPTEYPDIEEEITAKNKKEAILKLLTFPKFDDWSEDMFSENDFMCEDCSTKIGIIEKCEH